MTEPTGSPTLAMVDANHLMIMSHDASVVSASWPETQNPGHSVVSIRRLWACPFYKLDPWAHYRCIEKHKLRRIADVKQHIHRCHRRTGHTAFPNLSLDRSDDDEQKWYRLWNILFRAHEQPPSPYVEDGIAEPIALLRNRAQILLGANLAQLLQALNIQTDSNTVVALQHEIQQLLFENSHILAHGSNGTNSPGISGPFGAGSVDADNTPLLVSSVLMPQGQPPLQFSLIYDDEMVADRFSPVLPVHHLTTQELSPASGFQDMMSINEMNTFLIGENTSSNSQVINENRERGQEVS